MISVIVEHKKNFLYSVFCLLKCKKEDSVKFRREKE